MAVSHTKGILLRPYQQDMLRRLAEAWKTHRSVMVQMPTGTGKTHVLAAVVREAVREGDVLIVAHRKELIAQITETLGRWRMDVENGKVKVASIQTLSRRKDSAELKPHLVIIDEAHHALARTYRMMWERWSETRFLGLTATPCRLNRTGFTELFDVLLESESIAEFVKEGVLSVFSYVSIRSDSEEQRLIDSLEKRGADGDYQIKEMDEVLNRRPSIERLYRSMEVYAKGKKGIVYAISVDHAHRIAEYYNGQGVSSAAIDGRTPSEERKMLVKRFKEGRLQVLVNVDVFSEGFDCPDVEFVQLARPTLSLAKYLQQVGRGLRKAEGKEACMLIDNVGLYRLFGLPVAARNWEAMFRGREAGRGQMACRRTEACDWKTRTSADDAEEESDEMRVVVSHDSLLETLEEWQGAVQQKTERLRRWQDKESGLWGLACGRRKLTEAVYADVFDVKDGQAAVRQINNHAALVDASGNVIWENEHVMSMKFVKHNFLKCRMLSGSERYLDLYSLRMYEHKPEIKRYGNYELLKVHNRCYTRTKEVYTSHGTFGNIFVFCKDFYLLLIEPMSGRFCLIENDAERVYLLHRVLADGSILVADNEGRYYHVASGKEKVCIGSDAPIQEREKCFAEMERLADCAEENLRMRTMKNEEHRQRWLDKSLSCAIPYQSGLKWGLKMGDRITVPPIYRNVQQPVGRYCAVEKNYSQWGVIAVDGQMVIEPKYVDVHIEPDGMALLTSVTGKKIRVKLD